jgi:hypothetical protein
MFSRLRDMQMIRLRPQEVKQHIMKCYGEIDRQQEQLNDQANQFQQLLNQKDFIINQLEQNSHGKE